MLWACRLPQAGGLLAELGGLEVLVRVAEGVGKTQVSIMRQMALAPSSLDAGRTLGEQRAGFNLACCLGAQQAASLGSTQPGRLGKSVVEEPTHFMQHPAHMGFPH